MQTDFHVIARYIRFARQSAHLSQEALGDRLGLTKANISAWENDRHSPSPQQLASVSRITGVALPEELAPRVGRAVDAEKEENKGSDFVGRDKFGSSQPETVNAASATFSEREQNPDLRKMRAALVAMCEACGTTLEEVYLAREDAAGKPNASVRVTSGDGARAFAAGILGKKSPRKAGNQAGG